MLVQHMAAVEQHLIKISQIPSNTGHTLHRGTPREAFIREFLEKHLSERVGIGSGEIIDATSQPRQARNQIDIVIYKRDYPKLDFGGGISGFLAESVVATIEVKSVLDEPELTKSINAARNVKALQRNIVTSFYSGYQPPGILSFVVAYDGPAKMSTVHSWIQNYVSANAVTYPPMPPSGSVRSQVPCPLVDGVIVLGKGFVSFDNSPISFVNDTIRTANPNAKWVIADSTTGGLLWLFLMLTQAVLGVSGSWLDPLPYLKSYTISSIQFEP